MSKIIATLSVLFFALIVVAGCTTERNVVKTISAPDKQAQVVVVERNSGATTDMGYELYLTTPNAPYKTGKLIADLYGPSVSENKYGVDVAIKSSIITLKVWSVRDVFLLKDMVLFGDRAYHIKLIEVSTQTVKKPPKI